MPSGGLHITPEYTSIACSCTPHSLDWGDGDRLCFGACRALAIATPLPGSDAGFRVLHTLHHHSGEVISVRAARELGSGRPAAVVVTGSRDHSAAVWDLGAEPPAVAAALRGHAGPVTLVDAVQWGDGGGGGAVMVATASTDCTLRLWQGAAPAQVAPLQTLPLGRGLALALRLARPPPAAAPWLFVGTDEAAVVIYAPVEGDAIGEENAASPVDPPSPIPAAADGNGDQKRAEYAPLLRLTGHEDWVRCLDAVTLGDHLLLASAGQDGLVRVWSVRSDSQSDGGAPDDPDRLRVRSQSLTVRCRDAGRRRFAVTLDSVLAGHDGWVYGLRWRPRPGASEESPTAAPQLASASMDRALLVWQHDSTAGVWVEAARLGAVGGNSLGLFGCAWSPDGARLVAHGHKGAMHVWGEEEAAAGVWRGRVPLGGHAGPVVDMAWAPGGGYLLSTAQDQTTRLHSRWQRAGSWHEMGRPQVHGHDMSCLATISDTAFASGAEEKVARAFSMPGAVRDTLATLCGAPAAPAADTALPEGAAVPSLGLTNKPVFAGEEKRGMVTRAEEGAESYFLRQQLTAPPAEETLLQNTLWPELRKLYGHGFELIAMAASHDARLLATTCRAAKPEHAAVLLWDTATWRQAGQLSGAHQLTVVQLAFSPDDAFLLAVSRDRTWSLWARQTAADSPSGDSAAGDATHAGAPAAGESGAKVQYVLCARGAKVHSRIIWCCAWLDGATFVTGSRDGQLLRWRRGEDGSWARQGQPYRPGTAVTAVAAAGHPGLIAAGLETGEIRLLNWGGDAWTEAAALDTSAAHHGAVKRLQFRPGRQGGATELLASCGADHAVKLHRVRWEGGE